MSELAKIAKYEFWHDAQGNTIHCDECSDAVFIKVSNAVAEFCAKIADEFARPIAPGTAAGDATQATGEAIAEAIRALKG